MPNYMSKEAIMKRLQEHYDRGSAILKNKFPEAEPFMIFLQGSQNYICNEFHEDSDVDSRLIVIPSFEETILERDCSMGEKVIEHEEHIEIFDIRKWREILRNPGINNFEGLFTEYVIVNSDYQEFYDKLVEIREEFARADKQAFMLATMGLSMRDRRVLQDRIGRQDYDIENFGFSRKRFSNILRFNHTIKAYVEGKPFGECLKAMDESEISRIRRTKPTYTLEYALAKATEADKETAEIAKANKFERDIEVFKKFDKIIIEAYKRKLELDFKRAREVPLSSKL